MKASLTLLCLAFAVGFAGTSCTSSREHRIARNAAYFNTLPPADQVLVRDGKIRLGLAKEAVILAMGKPGRVSEAVAGNGQTTEIWSYFGYRPIYAYDTWHSVPIRDCHGRIRGYQDLGPDVAYVPYLQAEVTFKHGVVAGWQKEKNR